MNRNFFCCIAAICTLAIPGYKSAIPTKAHSQTEQSLNNGPKKVVDCKATGGRRGICLAENNLTCVEDSGCW